MKRTFKYILSLLGLFFVMLISVSATADVTKLYDLVGPYVSDPIDLIVILSVSIGFMSFANKFANDVFKWFSTGLTIEE